MDIKAVIFDLDGTIADTIPLTVFSIQEVIREFSGLELSTDEVLKEFGPIDTDIVRKYVTGEKEEPGVEAYIKHFSENFCRFVNPIGGIRELLEYIKSRGIKVGLFTGRSLRVTKIVLEKLGIADFFDEIMAGDFTQNPKPDPEGILKTLKKLGVSGNKSIYVGDYEVDIRASKAAGTLSVLALWSSTGSEALIKYNPDKFFKSPYDFLNWLEECV